MPNYATRAWKHSTRLNISRLQQNKASPYGNICMCLICRTQTMAFAALAILGHKSAHSFPIGPVIAEPEQNQEKGVRNYTLRWNWYMKKPIPIIFIKVLKELRYRVNSTWITILPCESDKPVDDTDIDQEIEYTQSLIDGVAEHKPLHRLWGFCKDSSPFISPLGFTITPALSAIK